MKTRVFNLIILDESGSMEMIKQQAMSGVNETVQTIRKAQVKHPEQEHYVTLVTFNSDGVKTLYDKIPAQEAEELTEGMYDPNSCTPLYDAMGLSLTRLRKSVAEDDTVLVTIITDGMENDSHEYTQKSVKALVDQLKKKGWVFTYMGANQDVVEVGRSISIDNVMAYEANDEGVRFCMRHENDCRSRFYDLLAENKGRVCNPSVNYNYFDGEEEKKEKHL